MLSTNNWRKLSAIQMLEILKPYISQLPITSANNITYSELIECFTFEIRKDYSVSGYPNLGKGFSYEEAKLSGLMESVEMCCIESLFPLEWYPASLKPFIENTINSQFSSEIEIPALIGDSKFVNISELIVCKDYNKSLHTKSLTNGLASGQFFDDTIVHSIYEIIERHMIGSKIKIQIPSSDLNQKIKSFIDKVKSMGLTCYIYIRGDYANTITIESHIVDSSLSITPYSYGGIGFGCSGNFDIAISRAIAEAFQCLSISKSIYLQSYGIGTHLTGPVNGYSKDLNNVHNSSIDLVPYILNCEANTTSNPNFSASRFSHVHTHQELIHDLRIEGINYLNYIVLTESNLPFTVIRCFIDQLSNSYMV